MTLGGLRTERGSGQLRLRLRLWAVPSPAAAHPPSFSHRDDGDGAELSEKGHSVNLRSRLPLLIYASSYGDFWSSTVLRATSRDRHTALCVRMRAPGLGVRTAAAA
jgi:hypothetical protein